MHASHIIRRAIFVVALLLGIACPLSASAAGGLLTDPSLADVAATVNRGLEAIYVTGDEATIRSVVHPDYAVLLVENDTLGEYTGSQLLADIARSKAAGRFPIFPDLRFTLASVDVVGDTAAVKVIVHQSGVHTCSDFILLYRFRDGWKFVSLTTHHHAELKRSW